MLDFERKLATVGGLCPKPAKDCQGECACFLFIKNFQIFFFLKKRGLNFASSSRHFSDYFDGEPKTRVRFYNIYLFLVSI